MKLLVGTHYFDSHRGGIEIVAGELARALVAHEGFSVEWMASDATDPARDFPGTTLALPCWNGTECRFGIPLPIPTRRALSLMRTAIQRCDVLLLHDALYPTNVAAARYARRLARPVVVVQHVGLVPYSCSMLRALMRLANRTVAAPLIGRADQVIFISGLTQRYFSSSTAFCHEPELILNGLRSDLPALGSMPTQSEARRLLGLREERFTALFVGRFVEKKGLAVIERLARALPDVEWAMCGWGPIDPTLWRLPNVRVLGAMGADGLASAYRAADALVLPSVGEGLPLVVQEALASGATVVGSDELLVADPWLRGRMVAVPVVTGDAAATAALWADVVRDLRGGRKVPPPCPVEARDRYCWRTAARAYARLIRSLMREAV